MLTAEENELVTKAGPGTPMGNLFRQYWLPALTSDELPYPDCPPVRIRILNEDLVAFRTTSGRVGLIQWACPHRSADFFFGRNEEEGIRCTYHGWKFDASGACVDMPSEPPDSTFKDKVRATAYPCVEVNGCVWTYMGPREVPPPPPDLESAMREGAAKPGATLLDCNWLQAVENNMDTSHLAFMHFGSIPEEAGDDPDWMNSVHPGAAEYLKYVLRQRWPLFDVRNTEYGMTYTGYREAEPDTYYHRMMNFLFPCFTMTPARKLQPGCGTLATVPIDDTHAMEWRFNYTPPELRGQGGGRVANVDPILPNGSHWWQRFRPAKSMDDDFELDREVQQTDKRTVKGYTGMAGIPVQDRALTISQGASVDRTIERLGTTDAAIIRCRQLLINAAKELQANGTTPPGVDSPEIYRQRSGWFFAPRTADWFEFSEEQRHGYQRELAQMQAAPVNVVQ